MTKTRTQPAAPLVREWEGRLGADWTALVQLRPGAGRVPALYLAYQSGDGHAEIGTFRAGRARPFAPLFRAKLSQREWGRFVPFLVDGVPHLLGYALNPGNVGVERIDLVDRTTAGVWKSNWGSGWMTVEGFELEGRTCVLSYRPHDGVATIDRITRDGRKPAPVWETGEDTWPTGFTTIQPLTVGGLPHLLFYRNRDGFAALARVRPGAMGVAQTGDNFDDPWERGWFALVPFETPGVDWLLRYRLSDGALELDVIRDGASGFATVWAGASPGWGRLVRFDDRGRQYLLGYDRSTGTATLDRFVGLTA